MERAVSFLMCAMLVTGGIIPMVGTTQSGEAGEGQNPASEFANSGGNAICTGTYNDELVIALQDDMWSMNPWDSDTDSVYKTDQLQFNFESLMAYDPTYNLYPVLAAANPTGPNGADAWVSGDGMKISFNLRQDVTFTDGEPMTSKDVVFAYQTLGWGKFQSDVLQPLYWGDGTTFEKYDGGTSHIGVEANGTYRVDFFLSQPNALLWPGTFALPICPWHIWQNHTIAPDPMDFPGFDVTGESVLDYFYGGSPSETDATVGTGPFFLESWTPGSGSVIRTYDNYWNKNGTVSCGGQEYRFYPEAVRMIDFEIIPQLEGCMDALRGGTVHHIAETLSPANLDMLRIDPNIAFETPVGQGFFYMCFNMRNGAIADVNFRRAVAYCVDKDYIADGIMDGYGIRGTVPLSVTAGMYVNDSVPGWITGGNTLAAAALLDASGYHDYDGDGWRDMPDHSPLRYDILTPSMDYDPVRAKAGMIIESNLRSVGLNVASVPTDFDTIISEAYISLDFDMYILGWTVGPFPEVYLRDFFHGDSDVALDPAGSNSAGYHNASVDSMIEDMETEMDTDTRVQLVKDICGATMMDLPYDTLYYKDAVNAFRKDVWQGWVPAYGSVFNRFSVCNLTQPSDLIATFGNLDVGIYMPDNIAAGANGTCYVLVADNDVPVDNAHVVVNTNLGFALDGYTDSGGCAEFDYCAPFAEGQAFFAAKVTKGADSGGAFKESSLFTDKSFAWLTLSTQDGALEPLETAIVAARVTGREGTGIGGVTVSVDEALMFGTVDSAQKTTDSLGFANFTYTAPPGTYIPNANRFDQFGASVCIADAVVPEVQDACLILAIGNDVRSWHTVDITDVGNYVISGNQAGSLPLSTDVTVSVLDEAGNPVTGTEVFAETDNGVVTLDVPSHFTDGVGEAVFTLSAVDGVSSRSAVVSFHVNGMYSTSDSFLLLNRNETDPEGGYAADIDFDASFEHGSAGTVTATVYDEAEDPAQGVPCQFFIRPTVEGIPGRFEGGDSWQWEEYGWTFDLADYAGYIGSWYGDKNTVTDGSGQLSATFDTSSFGSDAAIQVQFGVGGYGVAEAFNLSANNFWMEDYGEGGNWVPPMTDNADGNYYWRAADFTLRDEAILWRGPVATMSSVSFDRPCFSSEDTIGTITTSFQDMAGQLASTEVSLSLGTANPLALLDQGPTDGNGNRAYAYDAGTGGFDRGIGFTAKVEDAGYSQCPSTFCIPYISLPDSIILTVEPSVKLVTENETVQFIALVTDIFGAPVSGALVQAGAMSNATDASGIAGFEKVMAGAGIQNTTFNVNIAGKTGSMTAGVMVGEALGPTPHLPIRINSNADFDEAHGVTNWATGNGTEGNPWIIEGWDVNGTGYGYCIYIGNTTDYFVVSDCHLHEANGGNSWPFFYDTGLILFYVQNGTIANSTTFLNNFNGIYLYSSNTNTIANNTVLNNNYGITLDYSSSNALTNNNASNNDMIGLCLSSSNSNTITNITASNNFMWGLLLQSSSSNTIVNNNPLNNYVGIWLESSSSNVIHHNNFISNINQAYDDTGTNLWDNGYPSGGNYWSDYNGTDLFLGPGQDIPGSDGIGDTPYTNIQGGTGAQDNYPLMSPWVPSTPEEFTIPIYVGWNLVSIPLETTSTDIASVLASITGQYDAVKYYSSTDATDPWKTYRPGGATNDLSAIDNTMGIWVHATAYCNLTVTGTIPASTQIVLRAGWNLVGYPTLAEETVGNALWGTGADRVEAFDPGSPYLISEVGPIYMMKPGDGYWIHVPADTIWTVNW